MIERALLGERALHRSTGGDPTRGLVDTRPEITKLSASDLAKSFLHSVATRRGAYQTIRIALVTFHELPAGLAQNERSLSR
jgi:hypothetical protein